jgi:hypothetical protein
VTIPGNSAVACQWADCSYLRNLWIRFASTDGTSVAHRITRPNERQALMKKVILLNVAFVIGWRWVAMPQVL